MMGQVPADRATDAAFFEFQASRRGLWDRIAKEWSRRGLSGYYYERLREVYRFLIPPGRNVLELGSGTGDILAAVQPKHGVGVDFSSEMVDRAGMAHPGLSFRVADVHTYEPTATFDALILSDLINDLWDVQAVFERARKACKRETRVIVNSYNKLWQVPLSLARRLGLARPVLQQNWLSIRDIENLLRLSGFEVVTAFTEVLLPVRVPVASVLCNKILVKLWPFSHLGLAQFVVARPAPETTDETARSQDKLSVSIVVPARNEAGHIADIVRRTPMMGARTEVIFVEGNSTDETWQTIREVVSSQANPDLRAYQQPGSGKGDAVRFGFSQATGDVLMILDADMTVAPEELPRFYRALVQGRGELINGVRLVYPLEDRAMRLLNYIANKLFGATFSWLLGQRVKDTLCGTKVLTREAYRRLAPEREYFGEFDPFGDFELLFSAAKSHLKIVDMPVRYRERRYGSTNIQRWRHGVLLLRMVAVAARKLKFV